MAWYCLPVKVVNGSISIHFLTLRYHYTKNYFIFGTTNSLFSLLLVRPTVLDIMVELHWIDPIQSKPTLQSPVVLESRFDSSFLPNDVPLLLSFAILTPIHPLALFVACRSVSKFSSGLVLPSILYLLPLMVCLSPLLFQFYLPLKVQLKGFVQDVPKPFLDVLGLWLSV